MLKYTKSNLRIKPAKGKDNDMTKTAYLEVRTQKQVGTWPRCGPDTYVAVQIVPDGAERPDGTGEVYDLRKEGA